MQALVSTRTGAVGEQNEPRPGSPRSTFYADVRGLPPTLLHVGSTEVLLDDSLRLAEKLMVCGESGPATHRKPRVARP